MTPIAAGVVLTLTTVIRIISPPPLPRPRPGHGITRCADNCLGSGSGLWPGPVRDGAEEGWPGSISWQHGEIIF